MKFKDQIGNVFELYESPKRIISLVPSQTELLVDLGLEENIVGVTKFCIHPKNLRKNKTIVGGTKNIKIDVIKELKPEIILCNKEENTKEIVELCQQITSTHVSNIFTINDTLDLIKFYGEIFSKEKEATKIIEEIIYLLEDFKLFIREKKSLKVAYFIWKDPWMVAGNNTFINHLLQLNKFENVFSKIVRYPEINTELLANEKPELIFLSSEPYPFKEKHIKELKEIIPDSKIILVDGELFSWYGSRLLKSFDYFKKLRISI